MGTLLYLSLLSALYGACSAAPRSSVRIIGGVPAVPGEFPYVVSIRDRSFSTEDGRMSPYSDLCVGTIVAPDLVITAAHCVYYSRPQDLQVMAGSIHLSPQDSSQQILEVVELSIHPDYHDYESTSRNDVAKIRTRGMVINGDDVRMIAKPPKDHQPSGQCWIAGWGQTASTSYSDVLLKAQIPVVSVVTCDNAYPNLVEPSIQVCAGRMEGGVDACIGDSGGPLICDDVGFPYIAGVVSWGYLCARPEKPGVYTKISSYTDWL